MHGCMGDAREVRAAWLSDLARAIDEAQQLAWRLGVTEGRSTEALELYVQLESARIEVESLRGTGSPLAHLPWPVRLDSADCPEPG